MDDNSLTKKIADSYELANNVLEHIPNPLVSIRTSAYNHGPYIKQCIEGVLMQRTNFPFEYIIGEDFSNDETREIVFEYAKKYPNIIRVITADYNVGSRANGRRCIQACRGKYMAICEGDDYWIDPLKLQKQVDFLERHQEYVLSHTAIMYYFQNIDRFVQSKDAEINKKIVDENIFTPQSILLNNYRIQTLSVLFRRDAYFNYIDNQDKILSSGYFLMGDTPLWYALAKMGKFHFLSDVTCVYRKHSTSVTGERNLLKQYRFRLSSYELRYYLSQKDELSKEVKDKFEKIYAIRLMEYLSLNPSFQPLFSIDMKNHKGFHYILYKRNCLRFFIETKECLFYKLKKVKNLFRKSV